MCYDKNLLEKITFFCLTTQEVYNNLALNEDDDTFSRALYQILPKLQKYRSFLLAYANLITMNQIITRSITTTPG